MHVVTDRCVFYHVFTCFVFTTACRVILAISVTDNLVRQPAARGVRTACLWIVIRNSLKTWYKKINQSIN